MTARYEYYEKLLIKSLDPKCSSLNGRLCAVVGRSCGSEGVWYYLVHVYDLHRSWTFSEGELAATGEFDRRETFYDGSRIRVKVDKDGRGRIVDSEQEVKGQKRQ
jgi:hypothetical protein